MDINIYIHILYYIYNIYILYIYNIYKYIYQKMLFVTTNYRYVLK